MRELQLGEWFRSTLTRWGVPGWLILLGIVILEGLNLWGAAVTVRDIVQPLRPVAVAVLESRALMPGLLALGFGLIFYAAHSSAAAKVHPTPSIVATAPLLLHEVSSETLDEFERLVSNTFRAAYQIDGAWARHADVLVDPVNELQRRFYECESQMDRDTADCVWRVVMAARAILTVAHADRSLPPRPGEEDKRWEAITNARTVLGAHRDTFTERLRELRRTMRRAADRAGSTTLPAS